MAIERLVEQRSADGTWSSRVDLNAFFGSAYVVMLRTTGYVAEARFRRDEALVVRHLVAHVNPDGGFYKYPGSPSCAAITRVALTAIRLALGDVPSKKRPALWFARNEFIDGDLEAQLRSVVTRADLFLRHGDHLGSLPFKMDHKLFEVFLVSQADADAFLPPMPWFSPSLAALMTKPGPAAQAGTNLNIMIRKIAPALSILYRSIAARNRWSRWFVRLVHGIGPMAAMQKRSFADIVSWIRSEQNEDGGWFFNPFYTCLDMMALFEAGVPRWDPAMQRGMAFLRKSTQPASDGGTYLQFLHSDMWDTSQGVVSCLRPPNSSVNDPHIRPALDFLVRWQGSDGSFAFASASQKDPDIDTTAFLLRPIQLASRTADGSHLLELRRALRRGLDYVLAHQDDRGGFSGWESTFVHYKPGSLGFVNQTMVDVATPDVTGRVLFTLGTLGMTTADPPVQRALDFIVAAQHANGAWWSRWWAGYVVGADFVLSGLGAVGVRYDATPTADRPVERRAMAAMQRAVAFLESHQNGDGGWGETIRADLDDAAAGVGPSTPLHTAQTISALLGCGYPAASPVIDRAMNYLLSTMSSDGRWHDDQVTFTVIARTYYYPYAFANFVLPVDALSDYLEAVEPNASEP